MEAGVEEGNVGRLLGKHVAHISSNQLNSIAPEPAPIAEMGKVS